MTAPGAGRTLLVAGTASHVGKSTVAAGLCRHLADRGVDVAPFKAQNMSNNARAVPRPAAVRDAGDDAGRDAAGDGDADRDPAFGEVGVSQYVGARAARVRPTTDHNPVLLKPRGDGESQLVLDGVAVAHYRAGAYYEAYWTRARERAVAAHARLAAAHDVVIAEGAGSIAEINLHDRDLANVETARFADADVLLVADIERGGVFASLVGTLELLPDDVRERVVGAVITKFRGDRSILAPGLSAVEERTGVPVVGVVPHDDPGLPAEDSLSLPAVGERAVRGDDDGVPDDRAVTIGVIRLPRISNATDVEPLVATPGVRVAYLAPEDPLDVDALLVPGTKNAVDDLRACRAAGLATRLRAFDGPIVGLCGGYQLLGERVTNARLEAAGGDGPDVVDGLGLLPVETRFEPDKRVAAVTWHLDGDAAGLPGASGPVAGYEIHAGRTAALAGGDVELARPFAPGPGARGRVALGAARGSVVGTYLHGLFETDAIREAFVDRVYETAGRDRPETDPAEGAGDPYDRAAELLREHVDLGALGVPE